MRKYTKLFPKGMWKDTKCLLRDMMVYWSKFELRTSEYKQETSAIQSKFPACNFKNVYGAQESINTIISFQPKLFTILITYYAQPSYNCIIFLPEPLNITFLCGSRKTNVKIFRKTNALLSYLQYVRHVQPI
jgi:hypothetical protein